MSLFDCWLCRISSNLNCFGVLIVALAQLQKLGVDILYRRDDDTPFEKGQDVLFDGFVVTEENTTNQDEFDASRHSASAQVRTT